MDWFFYCSVFFKEAEKLNGGLATLQYDTLAATFYSSFLTWEGGGKYVPSYFTDYWRSQTWYYYIRTFYGIILRHERQTSGIKFRNGEIALVKWHGTSLLRKPPSGDGFTNHEDNTECFACGVCVIASVNNLRHRKDGVSSFMEIKDDLEIFTWYIHCVPEHGFH